LKLRSIRDKISLTNVAENRNQAVEMNGELINSISSIDIIKEARQYATCLGLGNIRKGHDKPTILPSEMR
jgi:hypothetical protein